MVEHPIEVVHYSLELDLVQSPVAAVMPDAPGRIRCACAMTVRAVGSEAVPSACFTLYRLLRVSAASEGADIPVVFRQTLREVDGTPDLHVRAVEVVFASPIAPGQQRTLRLLYEGPLVGYREAMAYVHDSVQRDVALLRPEVLWYPVPGGASGDIVRRAYRTPAFDAVVRLPEGWWVAMAGARRESDATDAPRFRGEDGYGDGLFLVAGRYGERSGDAAVTVHHLPGHSSWADTVVEAAAFTASTLTEWLGPRASRRDPLVLVEIPAHWGSQVARGFILQIRCDDPRSVFANVSHEVSHHWTPGADRNRFCDEGVAHYLQALVEGVRYGDGARWERLRGHRERFLQRPDAAQIPLARAAEYPAQIETVSRHRGPLALAVLHACLGDTGFRDWMRSWIGSESARSGGTVAHFCQYLRAWELCRRGGFDVDRYVREWFEVAGPLALEGGADRPITEAVSACAARYQP